MTQKPTLGWHNYGPSLEISLHKEYNILLITEKPVSMSEGGKLGRNIRMKFDPLKLGYGSNTTAPE